jgi:hypothetical protein
MFSGSVLNIEMPKVSLTTTHLYWRGIGIPSHGDGDRELLHKHRQRAQLSWEDKVEE